MFVCDMVELMNIGGQVMRDWIPIFREVDISRLIEISMLIKKASSRTIETLQSLHHGFIRYQHVRT
jgi:hypothetical protein